MADPEIHQFICLSDNYGVLLREPGSGVVASIDAPEAEQVAAALAAKGWRLTHILTTHHHGDHTDGNAALKRSSGCTIIGPKGEAARIPEIDKTVGEGDTFMLGGLEVRVLDTPGHTAGHISYWLPDAKIAFVGDTLFAIGCGRVIEGTPEMMWRSLAKIRALPSDTSLYCGHEYTLANARFALTIEPENAALQARAKTVEAQRSRGEMTLPTTVALERETNPFLRPQSAAIRKRLGLENAEDWQVFAEIRERKNRS
ncbi:MAG TPA: hydroxyacylglutathione hydrolase [Hyphomicrobiaceae bacterium]|nr:hydroxyacylglutathione hydrolase [Hyphomicrobiaceae bacterium]